MVVSGTYRWVTSSNPIQEAKAYFNNNVSQADLDLMTAPGNTGESTVCLNGNKLNMDIKFTGKPEWNNCLSYELGVEKALPEPFKGMAVITKVSDNCLKELVTYPDGNVYTYESTFSSFGMSTNISSNKLGHISTSIWERQDVDMTGFWILESGQGLEEQMMADIPGLTKDSVKQILSYVALRVTEKDGLYTMTDSFGNGAERTITYRIGEEYEEPAGDFSPGSTNLLTQTGPGQLKLVSKLKNGKTQVWNMSGTKSMVTWTRENPTSGKPTFATYRRYGDVCGSWKLISYDNIEVFLKAMRGMTQQMMKDIMAERPTMTMTPKGKGVWEASSDAKAMPFPTILMRFGEEFSFEIGGQQMSEIIHLTQNGMTAVAKSGEITMSYKMVIGKAFMSQTACVVGKPETQYTSVFARV